MAKENILRKLNKAKKKIMLIVILIVVTFVFMIGPIFWGTIKETFTNSGKIFSDVLDNVKINGDELEIDQDYLQTAKKRLKSMGIEPESLGLAGHEEYLERFLETEIVTNYPHLGDEGLQGTVYFERAQIDGSTKNLEYIEYDSFYELVDEQNSEIYNYFTVDTDDWTVHVGKNSNDEEINIEKINYKNMVSKFSLPFEFSISLAMVTQNPQFVLAVVNLVKNSKIVITIAESKTITTTETVYSYHRNVTETTTGTGVSTSIANEDGSETSSDTKTIYSTQVFLSRANTWILNEITELKYNEGSSIGTPGVTELEDITNSSFDTGVITLETISERKNTVTITTEYQNWKKGKTQVIEKTDNFINLILRDTTLANASGLISVAKTCHDYLAENEYWYPSQANLDAGAYVSDGDPVTHRFPTEGEGPSERYVDCSAYVSWVLLKAGYDIDCKSTHNNSLGAFGQEKGWEVIDNVESLEPGDICFWGGNLNGSDPYHVNIFVGKDGGNYTFYDCGSTTAIRAIDPISYDTGEFGYAFRPNDDIAKALSPTTTEGLKEKVENYLSGISNGEWTVGVRDLNSSSSTFTINNKKMESDGLLKLFIMATVYKEVNAKNLQEEDVSAEIERMIVANDNQPANELLKKLGKSDSVKEEEYINEGIKKVNKYIKAQGYSKTNLAKQLSAETSTSGDENNYTSGTDVSNLLKNIFNGKCVNKDYSTKMLEILKGQLLTEGIPSTIEGGTVGNKTGEQSNSVQDAAIVSIDNADYVITIMASNVENKDEANNQLKDISTIVYGYFLENGKNTNNENNTNSDDEIKTIMNGRRVCYKVPGAGYQCPYSNLVEGADMLFDLLAGSQKTQEHERLMRYLMYLLTGKSYGVTEFDFEEFLNANFSSVGGIHGNTIQEKVWYALRTAGYSEYATAGVMGNIEAESGFNAGVIEGGSGIGAGLCQWSFGRRTQLEDYAASKGKDWSDENTQIEFLLGELTPGGGADGYASYQLMTYGGYSPDDWINANDVDTATTAFCWSFERPGVPRMDVRITAAQMYYDQFSGIDLSTFAGGSGGSGDIINTAREVSQYMIDNNIYYAAQTWNDIETTSESDSGYVCATYVAVVLYRSGLLTADQINAYNYHWTGAGGIPDMLEAAGWQQVSTSEAQEGDVCVNYTVHTFIYAGGDLIYDESCAEDMHSIEPYSNWSWYANDANTMVFRAP